MGTYEEIKELIEKAKVAQEQVANYTQAQIDEICVAIGWEVYNDENIALLAEAAVEETKMGNVPDKIKKHKGKVLGVLADVKDAISVGLMERNEKTGISKYAKPVGVVAALTPVTNPTATPASNGVTIVKGGNAVIFAPHPKAKVSSKMAVDFMRKGLEKVGAPVNLIQILEEPSIEKTGELMKQADVILATGGSAMVKAAYSSGTPAYGVGPGNSVQMVAEDADVVDAAAKLVLSKAFDNATSCSSENSVIIQEGVYDQLLDEFIKLKSCLVLGKEREQLKDLMWKLNKRGKLTINGGIVAKSAIAIAELANIVVPEDTIVLLVEGETDIEADLFSLEKLSPVLTLYKYTEFKEGYEILKRITDNCGTGHSCGIHTFNKEYTDFLVAYMKTSRIMINQPQAPANGGNFFNGMPSTVSLGCGSWGGNITTENINYKHFLNITWVSEYITPVKPTDEEIFGGLLKKDAYK